MEIWATQYGVLQEALIKAGITMADVAGIGITNSGNYHCVGKGYRQAYL